MGIELYIRCSVYLSVLMVLSVMIYVLRPSSVTGNPSSSSVHSTNFARNRPAHSCSPSESSRSIGTQSSSSNQHAYSLNSKLSSDLHFINSHQDTFSYSYDLGMSFWKHSYHEFRFRFEGSYKENKGERQINIHKLTLGFDLNHWPIDFLTPFILTTLEHVEPKQVNLALNSGIGLKLNFIDGEGIIKKLDYSVAGLYNHALINHLPKDDLMISHRIRLMFEFIQKFEVNLIGWYRMYSFDTQTNDYELSIKSKYRVTEHLSIFDEITYKYINKYYLENKIGLEAELKFD